MKEIKLIEILKTFDKEELKSFKKFLSSPFIKSRRNIEILLNNLIPFHPEFDSDKLESNIIYKKIFPGEAFDEKKLNNFVADLTRAAKDFIIHLTLDEDETESSLFLLKGLNNRKLLKDNFSLLNSAEEKLIPGFSSDKNYFSKVLNILDFKIAYYLSMNDYKNLRKTVEEHAEVSMIRFYTDYTWMRCENHTTTHTLYKKNKASIIDSVTASLDTDKVIELGNNFGKKYNNLIKLHNLILKTIKEPKNSVNYFLLKNFFMENIKDYDREEKYKVLSHLINFCGENIVNYGEEFAKELLENYKIMLRNNAFSMTENEFLLDLDYRNIQGLTVLYYDADFLETLINDYSKFLRTEHKEDFISISYAYLFFLRKEFEKSLESIAKIRSDDFLFKIDMKKLKLVIFYELGYIEQAFTSIDSFKHFLTNSKDIVADPRVKSSLEFLSAFTLLLKIRTGKSEENIAILKNRIAGLNVFIKDWFTQKIEELQKIKY
ncbi:MAG TPA: hypothetical protein PKD83_02445 [Ignavibacteria bacterium]|nr:hypothetical protein [Ignavibacteria bacterium]